MRLLYYLLLLFLFIFLGLFPKDESWNIISTVFFWLIGIGYLTEVVGKNLSIDQLMKHGLFFFILGTALLTFGIFAMGEIFFKLSFLVFILGIIWSFVNYKKVST